MKLDKKGKIRKKQEKKKKKQTNKHKYNNYSGLPFEMQLLKAIK